MGVIKVLNSKSDLQGHSVALAMVPLDRFPINVAVRLSLSYTVNQIVSRISQNVRRSRDSEHILLRVMHALVLLCINQYTEFEVPSFTNYKHMIGGKI